MFRPVEAIMMMICLTKMLYNSEKHNNCKISPVNLGHSLTDKPDKPDSTLRRITHNHAYLKQCPSVYTSIVKINQILTGELE